MISCTIEATSRQAGGWAGKKAGGWAGKKAGRWVGRGDRHGGRKPVIWVGKQVPYDGHFTVSNKKLG